MGIILVCLQPFFIVHFLFSCEMHSKHYLDRLFIDKKVPLVIIYSVNSIYTRYIVLLLHTQHT